jgi:hypothetical protein
MANVRVVCQGQSCGKQAWTGFDIVAEHIRYHESQGWRLLYNLKPLKRSPLWLPAYCPECVQRSVETFEQTYLSAQASRR